MKKQVLKQKVAGAGTNAENSSQILGVKRGSGVALWKQIQSILERELLDGVFPAGERLPTEKNLSERFSVNRHTVRQAMAELVRKDLIVVEQGRGAFVRKGMLDYALARRVRFRENLLRQSKVPSEELLGADIVPADRKSGEALRVKPETALVRLRSLGNADGQPICCTTQFFPHGRFPEFANIYAEERSVTATFIRMGIPDYVRVHTRIMSRLPDAGEMRMLHITRHTPVMVVESVNADGDGIPIEYGKCVWAADRIQFVIDSVSDEEL